EADRVHPVPGTRRGCREGPGNHRLRAAAQAQPRGDGERCGRAGRRAQAEGTVVKAKVLNVAEHQDGKLNASTAKCVSAAQALSPESIDVVVLAADAAGVAAEASGIAGVSKVLAVSNPANEHAIAQVLAPQVAKLTGGYGHVFG